MTARPTRTPRRAKPHATRLVGPSKVVLCPGCLGEIVWVAYIPLASRMVPGQPRTHLPLDYPALVSGALDPTPQELLEARASHASTSSLLDCRLITADYPLLRHENAHSLHYATAPACREYLTDGETR